jgi:hypothetical protein
MQHIPSPKKKNALEKEHFSPSCQHFHGFNKIFVETLLVRSIKYFIKIVDCEKQKKKNIVNLIISVR